MKPDVFVTGDLVCDHYLYQYPTTPSSYHEPSPPTVLREESGGAWHLSDLIQYTCDDRKPDVRILRHDGAVVHSFSVLSDYRPRASRGKGEEPIWRVRTFLGCQRPKPPAPPVPAPPTGGGGPAPRPSPPAGGGEPAPPGKGDILLIDDLGLGFNQAESLWPAPLSKSGEGRWPGPVVMKTRSAHDDNRLLKRLLLRNDSDLTVILSADVLRARGAAISQGLSWDRTIEETSHEFAEGLSSQDLARCRRVVVRFGMAGVASFARQPEEGERYVTLERFLYHPEELEGDFEKRRPGLTFGVGSFLAAALTRHEIDRASFPLYIALGNSLAAARFNHEKGFLNPDAPGPTVRQREEVREMLQRPRPARTEEPAFLFFTAFPHGDGSAKSPGRPRGLRSDLLADLTGTGLEYVTAKATEVVLRGIEKALEPAPKARFGDFITVDRDEIERINAIRRLAEAYLNNPDDLRPLSIAVFGPPGSGKSSAIKQLAEVLFGEKREALTFNLSGFEGQGLPHLHEALHRVRDASVQGRVPLVFWDEFDSDDLGWLKHFLAPMQDAEFRAGSLTYPIGRAIFVFAGGTKFTFRKFDLSHADDARFIASKGPDFVSRLRGFIDIKGPNPVGDDPRGDPAHLIRRAVLLRSVLERSYPDLIDVVTKQASVSPGVLRAFLRVERYLHGARSLVSLVHASRLRGARHFGPSQLPPPDLLSLYVSPDFARLVAEGELELMVVEALAEAGHLAWKTLREEEKPKGWTFGDVRDDVAKKHPLLVDYDKLSEKDKEANRSTARLVSAKLAKIGYTIRQKTPGDSAANTPPGFSVEDRKSLMEIEHQIWMRDHQLRGYEYAETTNESLRLHRDLVDYNDPRLDDRDRELDAANIDVIPKVLWERGYKLVKSDPPAIEPEATAGKGGSTVTPSPPAT